MPTHDERVAHYLRTFEGRVLEVVADTERLQCVMLRFPGRTATSTVITAGPGHIHIAGDLCPARGVTYHTGGTTRMFGWLVARTSASHLAEKFLEKAFSPSLVQGDVEHALRDAEGPHIVRLARILVALDNGETMTESDVIEAMGDLSFETADGIWGFGYPPDDLAMLCAIQQQFSQLWRAHKASEAEAASDLEGLAARESAR